MNSVFIVKYQIPLYLAQQKVFFFEINPFDSIPLALLIYFIGMAWLLLNWQNFLMSLLCIELMYLGIVLAFILVGLIFNDPKGHIYSLIFIVLAASESAIGLGVLIVLYRYGHSIKFSDYQGLLL